MTPGHRFNSHNRFIPVSLNRMFCTFVAPVIVMLLEAVVAELFSMLNVCPDVRRGLLWGLYE